MNPTAILYPVFVQVGLTLVVLILMGSARARSLRASQIPVETREVRLGEVKYSDAATQLANNFANQFELPVLFYAFAAFALVTRQIDFVTLGLAWAFVISRIIHAIIHIGPNVIRWRGIAYIIGLVCLVLLWLKLAIAIITT